MSLPPPAPEASAKVPAGLLLFALVFPTLAALGYFVAVPRSSAPEPNPFFQAVYAGAKFIQFALPVAWLLLADRSRLRAIRLSFKGVLPGAAFGLFTLLGMLWLYLFVLRGSELLQGLGSEVRTKLAEMGMDSPARFVALAGFLSVIHSFLEEYYWRWFVHGGLRERLPGGAARLVSSLAFAAHHVVVLDVYLPGRFLTGVLPLALGVAVGGYVWAGLYERSGSLAGPWVAHIFADVALMAIGYDAVFR